MASKKQLLEEILFFLNFSQEASFEEIRQFLIGRNFCQFELISGNNKNVAYSLYSREEIIERKKQRLPLSQKLIQATKEYDSFVPHTLLVDRSNQVEDIILPVLEEAGFGAALKGEFYRVMRWFQTFMLACSAGVIDIDTLNAYRPAQKYLLEFIKTERALQPVLIPTYLSEESIEAVIETRIFVAWIYPFIFSGDGAALAKIRRCRQCGIFFMGVRMHAAFCTTKCRMAHNYMHR